MVKHILIIKIAQNGVHALRLFMWMLCIGWADFTQPLTQDVQVDGCVVDAVIYIYHPG